MIKFSIITVCLNAGNDLLETVESTLKQSYSEFEIIVKMAFQRMNRFASYHKIKEFILYKKETPAYMMQ